MWLSIFFLMGGNSAQAFQAIPPSCKKISFLSTESKKLIPSRQIRPGKPVPADWVLNVAHYELSGDSTCRRVIDENVEELLSAYVFDTQERMQVLVDQIRDHSFLKIGHPGRAYLFGANHTDKREFVNSLSQALGLPVFHLSIHQDNSNWISQLESFFRNVKYANPIIHIEVAYGLFDGSSTLPNELRGLIDDSSRRYILADGTVVDTSQVTFFVSGPIIIDSGVFLKTIPQLNLMKLI